MLVGTTSIESSEKLSQLLLRRGVPHEVLNAKQHEREAYVIAQAGRPGAVTVATNMAGRGTDIVLGGNPVGLDIDMAEWQNDHDTVVEQGGLTVLGTEHHESRRIDNQLRGRSVDVRETRARPASTPPWRTRLSSGSAANGLRTSWVRSPVGLVMGKDACPWKVAL